MSSDLSDRADDYERRLSQAGSTEGLIRGLVRSVDRSKRIVTLLVITLIVDLTLSLVMAGVAYTAWTNTQRIQASTVRLSAAIQRECATNQLLVKEITNVYITLIEGASLSDSFTPVEKAERIARYRKAIPPAHHCTKP